jgi:hypothetical protein
MEEIIKELKEIRKNISNNHKIVDVDIIIRLYDVEKQLEALTIPVVINWVAVSDRLPDHLQKVIMYGKQTEYSKYEQITGVLNRAGGLNQWNTYGIIMHEVTYWTPALEPPCL